MGEKGWALALCSQSTPGTLCPLAMAALHLEVALGMKGSGRHHVLQCVGNWAVCPILQVPSTGMGLGLGSSPQLQRAIPHQPHVWGCLIFLALPLSLHTQPHSSSTSCSSSVVFPLPTMADRNPSWG